MTSWLIEFINSFISGFNTYAIGNPVVAGVVSLWGLSVLSYFGRNIPQSIWKLAVRQTTSTMVLMSSSPTFYNFQTWFYKKGYSSKARAIKLSSGRWGEDTVVKSIGYGNHYFIHNRVPFKINMTKVDSTNTLMERDEFTITVLGRSHKFFDLLFKEIKNSLLKENRIPTFKFNKDFWEEVGGQVKRDIDTVFLKESTKDIVLNHIDTFVEREEWYLKNGLSYHTGILLHGSPGSGKTSFIKAIASEYNRPLYILSSQMLSYIENAIVKIPENALFLIEDIDTNPMLHERGDSENTTEKDTGFSFTNLSDVLNSLDGIIITHGRILIATTNHIEKLDAALLREGRFDIKVQLGCVDNFVIKSFFERYYPDFLIDPNFEVIDNLPACNIQNLILKNLNNPKVVLEQIRKDVRIVGKKVTNA